jgi:hypothetical protein
MWEKYNFGFYKNTRFVAKIIIIKNKQRFFLIFEI